MTGREGAIEETLRTPERVLGSLFDSEARLYYRFYRETTVGAVPMCRGQDNPGRCLRADCLPDGQREAGVEAMARDRAKVWYDAKGDYLEVLFDQRPGYFRETANEQVMEKVDAEGNVLGFSVLKVSGIGAEPLEVAL